MIRLLRNLFGKSDAPQAIGMEYINPDSAGRVTLADYFRDGIGPVQLTRWGMDICKGMSHAFAKGLNAHRDLKPEGQRYGRTRIFEARQQFGPTSRVSITKSVFLS